MKLAPAAGSIATPDVDVVVKQSLVDVLVNVIRYVLLLQREKCKEVLPYVKQRQQYDISFLDVVGGH